MKRAFVSAGPRWGDIVGYSRAVKAGPFVAISGTTATDSEGDVLFPNDPGKQTRVILDKIDLALRQLGASIADVIETRIYVTDIDRWEDVGRVHGEVFGTIRPATAMVEVKWLIDPKIVVEISALAVVAEASR